MQKEKEFVEQRAKEMQKTHLIKAIGYAITMCIITMTQPEWILMYLISLLILLIAGAWYWEHEHNQERRLRRLESKHRND